MNINDKNIVHQCTSCQLCAAVCPKNAISIHLNKDGFYRPIIDNNLCIDCGLCVKACYKYDNDIKMSTASDLDRESLYAVWANDDDLVKSTTSGGIGDLLARALIKEGYKVVGVVYNDEMVRAEHRIACTLEETLPFRGSKYIQSYTMDALKEVVANCKSEKYAVFGTPCQIYALNRWVRRRKVRENFFFVDFFCHGCPSLFVWIKYQQSIKLKLGLAHFDKVDFRSKERGWGSFHVAAINKGCPVFVSNPKEDGFYELFFSNQVLNDSCEDCILRGTLEYTDIRMGDFWGKKFLDNNRGVSAVSIVTEKAKDIFAKTQGEIHCEQANYSDFLPYQCWGRNYESDKNTRKAILDVLRESDTGILEAVAEYRKHQNYKSKFLRCLKYVLYYCPSSFTVFLKKIR